MRARSQTSPTPDRSEENPRLHGGSPRPTEDTKEVGLISATQSHPAAMSGSEAGRAGSEVSVQHKTRGRAVKGVTILIKTTQHPRTGHCRVRVRHTFNSVKAPHVDTHTHAVTGQRTRARTPSSKKPPYSCESPVAIVRAHWTRRTLSGASWRHLSLVEVQTLS